MSIVQPEEGVRVAETGFSIQIDRDACVGHGRCFDLHPDMFGADDEGMPVLIAESFAVERHGAAIEAVRECPERALSVTNSEAPS